MELSFVANAIRRRPWIVLLCALLGLIPGLLKNASADPKFESLAVVLVSPPSEGQAFSIGTGNDRYVENQLSVLQGSGLAERVANQVDGGLTRKSITEAVRVIREPGTDLVNVYAADADAEVAHDIAQKYVDIYMDDLQTRADEAQGPEIERLNGKLITLLGDIKALDDQILAAVAEFLPEAGRLYTQNETFPQIPTPDMVAGPQISLKQAKLEEYSKTLDLRTELELNAKLKVTSEIVQNASLPDTTVGGGRKVLFPLGLIAGAVMGAIAAAFVARLSPKVLDGAHASHVLDHPIVGSFARVRSISKQPVSALSSLPPSATPVINELCVRAEGNAEVGRPLTIVVVGTQRNAGTTTLAMAMAGRFANHGSKVLIVDADSRRSSLSRLFRTTPQTSIPALISEFTSGRTSRDAVIKGTQVAEVNVVGLGDKSSAAALRRDTISTLLDAASKYAEVIIFDGGPVLDAATTLHLCNVVDAVVLAIPIGDQRGSSLRVVRQQLGNIRGVLLPVLTHPTHKRAGRKEQAESTSFVQSGAPVVVDVVAADSETVGSRRS